MCGITGFCTVSRSGGGHQILQRMTDVIRHRGPDDEGSFVDDYVALGHRRLSIIDVAGGHQPMTNEDGSLIIIYNGEIFNHADLAVDLKKAGHCYGSHCDTETILHSYEEYKEDCVTRFRGMFAFVIWDKVRHQLFCARDRLGIKPLYYYWDGQTFVFGSEIKSLLKHPAVSTRFQNEALPEVLTYGYTSGEETLFEGIRKLLPGHTLTLETGRESPQPVIRKYWDVLPVSPAAQRPDHEWIAECRSRMEETVRMRLMSDVPLGMFLSGGIDSSIIAAMIRRMVSGSVKTFSVGYAENAYSELPYARQVAECIGTEHYEIKVGMQEFFGALPKLIWHEDEPIAWPSSVSLHFVSMLAAQQVKVVLTGEGSDELFAGYSRYRLNQVNLRYLNYYQRLSPAALRRFIRSQISANGLLSADFRRKLSHSFLGREESLQSLYLDNFYSAFSASTLHSLKDGMPSPHASFLNYWNAAPDLPLLSRMLYADQKTYLAELLMKQDQMSMSASIESRVPFLDHTFVEFAMSVPDHLKIRGSVQKYILKEAVTDLLPSNIIHRRKMGFPTPLTQWLRDPSSNALLTSLLDRDGLLASCLDLPAVKLILESHRKGTHDRTDAIWRLLNLQIWGDLFITGRVGKWQIA